MELVALLRHPHVPQRLYCRAGTTSNSINQLVEYITSLGLLTSHILRKGYNLTIQNKKLTKFYLGHYAMKVKNEHIKLL